MDDTIDLNGLQAALDVIGRAKPVVEAAIAQGQSAAAADAPGPPAVIAAAADSAPAQVAPTTIVKTDVENAKDFLFWLPWVVPGIFQALYWWWTFVSTNPHIPQSDYRLNMVGTGLVVALGWLLYSIEAISWFDYKIRRTILSLSIVVAALWPMWLLIPD